MGDLERTEKEDRRYKAVKLEITQVTMFYMKEHNTRKKGRTN